MQDTSNAQQLPPISGKCSIAFQGSSGRRHDLKHADITSPNLFTVHFKLDGKLWLWQQIVTDANTGGRHYLKRTIVYDSNQIKSPKVDTNPDSPLTSYQIKLEIDGPPVQSFETNTLLNPVVGGRVVKSEEFPIHTQSQTEDWKFLTMTTEAKGTLKNFTPARATALLLNRPSYHKSVDQETWLQEQYQAMASEADYTADKMSKFKNVTAECVRAMNFILVKIRFPSANEAEYIDDSFIMNNLAQRYSIEGPTGSILSPENVTDYVTRTGKTTMFTGALVDYEIHADCVIQLRILQEIPSNELSKFHKQKIYGVILYPSVHDQTHVEANFAHGNLNKNFDMEDAREMLNLFSSPQPATVIPAISARRLFLAGEKPLIDRKFNDGSPPLYGNKLRERDTLPSWNRLDRWQQEAVRQTDEFPLSIIEGPPGTGKSRTIAAFLACRTTIGKHERIMICAPRNVAVRKLLDDTVSLMQSDGLCDDKNAVSPLPLVHVESEGMIDASYLCAKPPEGIWHLQNLRIRRAEKFRDLRFLRGVEMLKQDGYIADPRFWSKYKEARESLTRAIMQNARMIFVTTSSARGTFLRALNFLPSVLVIDECGCAKPQDIAIPMMAMGSALTRMVLAGDSRQLRPLIFTKSAQKIWATSILAELTARGHTTTRLNIEYRSHSSLYAATSQVFYEGTVQSFNDTALYAPPLNTLMQSLPRAIFQDDDTVFRLSGFTHFLDIQEGKCEYAPGGSSVNKLEARVAISLVRGLLATVPGLMQKHFLILSGYSRQVKFIKSLARDCGYNDLPVKTVDAAQGAEAGIAILSIVRDGGDLGFMQSSPRVNVATSRQKTALYILGSWTVATSVDRKNEGNTNHMGRYLQYARSKWPNYILRPEPSET